MSTIYDPESPYILARYQGTKPPAPFWFDAALARTPERTSFPSQGAAIELLCWGEIGQPGLLFLHGNGAHADWWSAIAPFFADDWRCAALSFSGMGRSERRAEGYTVDLLAQEIRDAVTCAQFNPGLPPIVIAHSMGGMLALRAAADNPGLRGLIIIDSPLGMPQQRFEAMREGAPKPHATRRPFASLAEGLARFRLSPPQPCINDYMVDHIARGALVEEDGTWFWHFDPRRISVPEQGIQARIDRVTCPLAFLYGERSAMLDDENLAGTRAALPPGAPMIAIPDAAHHVPIDQPLALVAALRALLAGWGG